MTINNYLDELNSDNQSLNYADLGRICDYSQGYICDIITEIADSDTSIYYSDIMQFIADNPESLADVIAEGLYDPSNNYDLFKHGQAAQFMKIENELYRNIESMLKLFAVDYLKDKLDNDMELSEDIENCLDDISCMDHNERLDSITDKLDELLQLN